MKWQCHAPATHRTQPPLHSATIEQPKKPQTLTNFELLFSAQPPTATSVASINTSNIALVNKLYTRPVPDQRHPPTPPPHHTYPLPGDICTTIRHANRHRGAGVNTDSLAGNVADMSRHVGYDTTCRSNFGQMGPCRRHKI
jgi:hypothetical protein